MEQTKPPPEKRAKIDLEASISLVYKKANEYTNSFPKEKGERNAKGVKAGHRSTLCRMLKLLTLPGNISRYALIVDGVPWVTLKTHSWALGKQMGQLDRLTISAHLERLKEAGFIKVSTPINEEKSIKRPTASCLVSISPDVIAYRQH